MKKGKTIYLSDFRYYPEDEKELEIREILYKMRSFRALYIISFSFWASWGIAAAIMLLMLDIVTTKECIMGITVIIASFLIPLTVIVIVKRMIKNKDDVEKVMENAHIYLSDVGEDFLEQLQTDLYKGLSLMRKRNLVISDNYIIGSIGEMGFNPVVFPKDQIREIAYKVYESMFWASGFHWAFVQEFYFRLKNGNEIMIYVKDQDYPDLALKALENCGIKMIDLMQVG